VQSIMAESGKSIEEILIDLGESKRYVNMTVERQRQTREPLPVAAKDMGLISMESLAEAIATKYEFTYFPPAEVSSLDAQQLSTIDLVNFAGYCPVAITDDGGVVIAVSSIEMITEAKNAFMEYDQKTIVIASEHTVQSIYRLYFSKTLQQFEKTLATYKKMPKDSDNSAILSKLWSDLLRHACYIGVSDIYLMYPGNMGMIKFMRDGVGEMFTYLTTDVFEPMMNVLVAKVSKLEELKKEPQEAMIDKTFVEGDLRVAYKDVFDRYVFRVQLEITPDDQRINAVIRVNDGQSQATNFNKVGFDEYTKAAVKRWIASPTGLVIVTGPTGSGKTTVLNAMLREIDPVERPVFTCENPIEYRNGMWGQMLMAKTKDQTEGEAARILLNSLLRKAPKVILFGELRNDLELLQNIMTASITGHLVFTTVHTNTAVNTIRRLLDIGASSEGIATCLSGVLGVRLVRLLCEHCKKVDEDPYHYEIIKKALQSNTPDNLKLYVHEETGCPHCRQGYRGRKLVYEALNTRKVQRLIESNASLHEIEKEGLVGDPMWKRGLMMVADGLTSLKEVSDNIDIPEET